MIEHNEATCPPQARFSRIGWGLLLMVIAQQGAGSVLLLALQLLYPALMENSWVLLSVNFLPLYLLGLPLLVYMLRSLPDLPAPEKTRIRGSHFALLALASMTALYGLSTLSNWLGEWIGQLKGGEVLNPLDLVVGDGSPWAVLLFVVLLAPLGEEFIFRGLLYKKLAGYGAKTYILCSALLFALYHVNLYQVFYAFALGLVLAWLTYASGNIRASVALHLLVNLLGTGLPLLLSAFPEESRLPTILFYVIVGLLCAVGVLSAMILARRRGELPMPFGTCAAPAPKAVFGNAGMIVLLLTLGAMTAVMVLL